MLIPIVVLTVPFIFTIIIVWIQSEERRKRHQLQADLYIRALDKGQPMPTDLFVEQKTKRNLLNVGTICLFSGVAIFITLWLISVVANQNGNASDAVVIFRVFSFIGIIPFLIGVAFVIIHFIEKKRGTNDNSQ